MVSLAGKIALVTGGSRGIGLAVARALVAEGAHVAITSRNAEELAEASRRLSADVGSIQTFPADVRLATDMQRVVAATVSTFGGLDILVNNAGIGLFANVADMAAEQWADVIGTNLTGAFNASHAAVPAIRQRGGGAIVNIGSLAATGPFAGGAAYCASKAGLAAFSDALMQEVRHDNIRVSCVLPGSVATKFSGDETRGADWKLSPEDVAEVVVDVLRQHPRSLASRVEVRPSKPGKS